MVMGRVMEVKDVVVSLLLPAEIRLVREAESWRTRVMSIQCLRHEVQSPSTALHLLNAAIYTINNTVPRSYDS